MKGGSYIRYAPSRRVVIPWFGSSNICLFKSVELFSGLWYTSIDLIPFVVLHSAKEARAACAARASYMVISLVLGALDQTVIPVLPLINDAEGVALILVLDNIRYAPSRRLDDT